MRYYIIKKGTEYVIYKVHEEQVSEFEEQYQCEILLRADRLMQLLIVFEQEIVFGINYPTN